MSITQITRDWSFEPSIVRIVSTDNLSTIGTSGYITAQSDIIEQLNSGNFQWEVSDMVLVFASNGWGFFTISSDFTSLTAFVFIPNVSSPVVVGNVPAFTSTGGNMGDSGIAANKILTSTITNPDVSGNFLAVDVTVASTDLASAATKVLQASSGSKQYIIRGIWLNKVGTNFSGGGGDRNIQITDGTTVWTIAAAAVVQALANTRWGDTNLPAPATASYDTSSAAGAAIVAQYQGGTADYSAGSLTFSLFLQRIA